jgi:eukaryotic-like serine/threonine-protein kinase
VNALREANPSSPLEVAHVLFMDIVAYSILPMDDQIRLLDQLQKVVRDSAEFSHAQKRRQLLRLPTGDGMALVFFGDAEAPARCALEVSHGLRDQLDLKLRMGIHTGPVRRVEDINANRNVAGGGINIAQRVMDCGDAGHILVSKSVADVLGPITRWKATLHDLGEMSVKHGDRVHLFNLYTCDAGNPNSPREVQMTARAKTIRTSAIAAAVAAALLTGLGAFYFWTHRTKKYAVAPVKGRRSVAVLGFKNLSGRPDEAWLSTALSEMLTTTLAAGGGLRTIPGENVARMKADLSLPDADSFAQDTLTLIRKNLGTDVVVLGSYLDLGRDHGGNLRLDLVLQDAAAGETIAALTQTGTEDQVDELVINAGAQLREKLGTEEISQAEAAQVKASLPSNTDATRLYAEGLAKLRVYDERGAIDLLQKAVVADGNYALAHAALSQAWHETGQTEKSKEAAKKAYELSASLSPEDRLWIEGHYRTINNEKNKAAEVYKALFMLHPDNLEYGLKLADVQEQKEALETVASLRTLPAPARDDPRIDLAEAKASCSRVGTGCDVPDRAVAAATRAQAKANAQGARFLVAAALEWQGQVLWSNGQNEKAAAAWKAAREIFASLGDRGQVAQVSNGLAILLQREGDNSGARKLFEESLAIHQALGSEQDEATELFNLTEEEMREGDYAGALKRAEQSLVLARRWGDKVDEASVLEQFGKITVLQGDPTLGEKYFAQAIEAYRSSKDKESLAFALINASDRLVDEGKLRQARRPLDEAIDIARQTDDNKMLASANEVWGNLLLEEDQLDLATSKYQETLATETQLQQNDSAAWTRLELARIAIEKGEAAAAEKVSRDAREVGRKDPELDLERFTDTVLADALRAQGKSVEAASEIENARAISVKMRPGIPNLEIDIVAARIDFALGKIPDAEKNLSDVITRADKRGKIRYQLYARLALGEGELKSEKGSAGRAGLAQLEEDARSKGYLLIARKAATTLRSSAP